MKTVEVQCHCGEVNTFEYDDQPVLGDSGQLVEQILDDQYQTFLCKSCSSDVKPELEALIESPWGKLDFQPVYQRIHFLSGNLKSRGDLIFFGYQELKEFIQLVNDQLDRETVEIMKFRYSLQKKLKNQFLLYHGLEGDQLQFRLLNNDDQFQGLLGFPRGIYDSTLEKKSAYLEDEDIQYLLSPPYQSMQKTFGEWEEE